MIKGDELGKSEQTSTTPASTTPALKPTKDIMVSVIGPFLSIKDKAHMARSCKQYYRFFQAVINAARDPILVAELQNAVASGNLIKALNNLETQPELLLTKSTTTDRAGRTFTNKSTLQNAIWSMNWKFLPLLMEKLPPKNYTDALNQLLELEGNDQEHGAHYDVTPLIDGISNFTSDVVNSGLRDAYYLEEMKTFHILPHLNSMPSPLVYELYLKKNVSIVERHWHVVNPISPNTPNIKDLINSVKNTTFLIDWNEIDPFSAGLMSVPRLEDYNEYLSLLVIWHDEGINKLKDLKQMLQTHVLAQENITAHEPTPNPITP